MARSETVAQLAVVQSGDVPGGAAPPADGPRVPAERLQAVGRELGVVNHGPPPPQLAR